jgi:hypothetical protein
LGGNTDLTIMQLDDDQLRLRLNRGSLQLHVRNAGSASEVTLDIPQGRIGFSEPTNVRIDTRDDNDVSAIKVITGRPYFDDGVSRFVISACRRAEVDRGGLRVMESRNNFRDDLFDAWVAERDRQDEMAGTPRYVSSDITGYQVLNSYGGWSSTTTYGPIWSPTVIPAGWAPYRDGRWTWIAPWGWTWVDNAPWGYAPSHYGRWVFYEQRWCWTPGVFTARPVWAPALVGWVGDDANNYSNTRYRDGPSIGWFPLAPREVFVPAYQATPRYLQQVNNGYPVDRSATYRASGVADPRATTYQNQFVRNATTVLPSYQFGSGKTVVVTPSSQRVDRVQQVRNLGATVTTPVTISVTAPPPIGRSSPLPSMPLTPRPLHIPTPAEPLIRSERRSVSVSTTIGASSATRTTPTDVVITTPRQAPYPAMSTVVVRPAQAVPLRQIPTAQLAVPVLAAPSGIHGDAPAALQKKEDANKTAPDQQLRTRLGGNGTFENGAVREGFGRGALQR